MRSDAREAAFKIVFANQFNDNDENFRTKIYKKSELNEEDCAFAERIISIVQTHYEELLAVLTQNITRFADYRIFPADKAIMLVALAEIKYCEDIPPVVSVSEAAALARKYSTENSANFVNGVLGGIINV